MHNQVTSERRTFYDTWSRPFVALDGSDAGPDPVDSQKVKHPDVVAFFKMFLLDTFTCPILGPLIPLFWISAGDISSDITPNLRYSKTIG